MPKKILTVVGARPQFIKAAPLSLAIISSGEFCEVIIHTGQHYDDNMSDIFFNELSIPEPKYNLGIGNVSHGAMTGAMLHEIEKIILIEKPDIVLVYGDTNSTLAGALAAAKLHYPVAHVEAGLRSFNKKMPEEINRVLTDHISTFMFCPTFAAVKNLENECLVSGIYHVGDIMYDSANLAKKIANKKSDVLSKLNLLEDEFAVCTIHRAENTDNIGKLIEILNYLKEESKQLKIVMPLHPRTGNVIHKVGISLSNFIVCDPVGYLDMAQLLDSCKCVYTDSGGLQKEAYFHRKPCVTIRNETEWVETIENGWNRLWTEEYSAQRKEITDYGSGDTANQILGYLNSNAA